MSITTESMAAWCRKLLGADPNAPRLTLEQYLAGIPRMECLGKLPSGTPVLVRGDTDAKPGPTVGEGDIRLRSMKETLKFGQDRGWKQIIFGHIGREPEKSLAKVAARLGRDPRLPRHLHRRLARSGHHDHQGRVPPRRSPKAGRAASSCCKTRENTTSSASFGRPKRPTSDKLAGNSPSWPTSSPQKVAKVYIHEAFSAGSLDASSVVVPAAMEKVALGKYEAEQFDGHLKECLQCPDGDFQRSEDRQTRRPPGDDRPGQDSQGDCRRFAGRGAEKGRDGARRQAVRSWPLAGSGPQGQALLHSARPDRAGEADDYRGRSQGDRVRDAGRFCAPRRQGFHGIGPGNQQFDVGPASSALYEKTVSDFIAAHKSDRPAAVVFHNGVFGMFEDPRFEDGTRKFIAQLKRMTDAGIKVYVGGGEGGTALEKYGQPNWVTYCFTAGGTVLNALGSEPVPYLVGARRWQRKRWGLAHTTDSRACRTDFRIRPNNVDGFGNPSYDLDEVVRSGHLGVCRRLAGSHAAAEID